MPIPSGIIQISDTLWELPKTFKAGMLVAARIYATRPLLEAMDQGVFEQISNVAKLPGILNYSLCMPDGHWGYGFPIGAVAVIDPEQGVISPGGIGFDINCGMRLVLTNLTLPQVQPYLHRLVDRLFERVPTGVGCTGFVKVSKEEFKNVSRRGARWCVDNGYGWSEDLERTEEGGCVAGADPAAVSDRAIERGFDQIGTLGSGNHYLEIQVAKPEFVFDQPLARSLGITLPDQIVIMFHCGSRGFGHQIATDYLKIFLKVMPQKYGLKTFDRELACAPFRSPEGQAYFTAMNCAINMAFANRQVILHRVREVFSEVFGRSPQDLGMHQVYDVAHNTAKLETHLIDGKSREVLVHRKGSTRAFEGQPVIIGGSMETGSYLLLGISSGAQSFFSTAHGSGRTMSRTTARKQFQGRQLLQKMQEQGIYVHAASMAGLAEEAGVAYKNIDDVVKATEEAGLSRRIVRFVPIGNVKG